MLTSWVIDNFKSFQGRTQIKLAPVTVFVGANSSGKSTILQSILLLKQTLEYAAPGRPLALNGPIIKLGTFTDVRNSGAKGGAVSFAWELRPTSTKSRPLPPSAYGPAYYPYIQSHRRLPENIKCQISYQLGEPPRDDGSRMASAGRSDELADLNPILTEVDFRYSQMSGARRNQDLEDFTISLRRRDKVLAAAAPESEQTLQSWVYDLKEVDPKTRADLVQWLEIRGDVDIKAANIQHFFPNQMVLRYDSGKDRAKKIAILLFSNNQQFHRDAELLEVLVPRVVVGRVFEFYAEKLEQLRKRIGDVGDREWLSFVGEDPRSQEIAPYTSVEQIRKMLDKWYRALVIDTEVPETASIMKYVEDTLIKDFGVQMRDSVSISREALSAIGYAQSYFRTAVKYLGPLRDEPRPFYPLEALGNPTDVGYRGEHTAAVLDLHRDVLISYFENPDRSSSAAFRQLTTATLKNAVIDWLSYMGVAENFSTSDRGTLGHTLKVSPASTESLYDLTNVGVGVSQVLPIIVMTLLAEAPCTLIFEQPELHLHPKVQARLADFFLAASLQGKQCILETHSEYLIERLRRRRAEGSDAELRDQFQIYFTERNEGVTNCIPVVVSNYGAISDWPKDFFDQSQLETEQILQAARRKRQQERRENSNPSGLDGSRKL